MISVSKPLTLGVLCNVSDVVQDLCPLLVCILVSELSKQALGSVSSKGSQPNKHLSVCGNVCVRHTA